MVLTTLALAGPAAAASKTCADDVIADWYGDGRVDKVFPLHCYQDAIRSLPVDVLDYSNAKQDILRALAFARKGKQDPGPAGDKQTTGTSDTGDKSETVGASGGSGGGTNSGGGGGNAGSGTGTGSSGQTGQTGSGSGSVTTAAGEVDTSGPSSLPIPLLVLGGLALLLLAAGGVGYLSRRAQARRAGGPPGPA
jgi:cobalamin biosynthesis Mg chelatase CobN